jgi:phytoene dehydrogenase-like protein
MSSSFDAVIVGGGHNGLVCGSYLARAGQRVCVLERRALTGGAAVTEELWPGYHLSTASYTMALLQPKIILDLELQKHGYEILKPPPMWLPMPDGRSLMLSDDPARTHASIAQFSKADADMYPRYRAHMQSLGPLFQTLLFEIAPDPGSRKWGDLVKLARMGWRHRQLNDQFFDLWDVMTLSAYDFLSRWFESDAMRAALGFYASGGGANSGIKSPGSAYVLMRGFARDHGTAAGGAGFVRGGMGSISRAIAASGTAHGMVVRTNAEVREIDIEGGRAVGVTLASGERIAARRVITNASAQTVFRRLVPARHLPPAFLNDVANIRDESTVFKLNLALDRLPTWTGFNPQAAGFDYPAQLRIGPTTDYIEQAFDPSKYGDFARRPVMTIITPSAVDGTLAPPGKHVMSIMGQHAPYTLRGRTWDEARDDLYRCTIEAIEAFAPGFEDTIAHAQVLTPLDFERIFDLPRGHVHHGELSADQIFFRRPVRKFGDYRTPIAGLFQCGASTHPGGGVTGVPGHNAAQVILQDKGGH